MRIKGKIPIIIVATFAYVVIISSCANTGFPSGGPKDTIPPVLLETDPKFAALNFKGKEVQFTFNEYISTEGISENLVVSPPLLRRPIVRTKSKTLVVAFDEELRDSTTYSIDFKNSISDNNEKNPYNNLRFSFSTGPVYDSLRVAGRVMDAFSMDLKEKQLVMLYRNLDDTAVSETQPDYVAKTDEKGMFLIDNIRPGKYHLFAIEDANSNLRYDRGAEKMAFIDDFIVPTAEFIEEPDTLVSGVDSFLVYGHTHFYPEPFYLKQFTEDIYDQYLKSNERDARNKCIFVFNESVKDTFSINLVSQVETQNNWYQVEYNENVDSLIMWIADTSLLKIDTLQLEIAYFQKDSLNQFYLQKDTLEMIYTDRVEEDLKRRKKPDEDTEDEPDQIHQFEWQMKSASPLELNQIISIISPEPIALFDSTFVRIFETDDTLKTPLKISIIKDTVAWRTYNISYNWEPDAKYTIEIDSAASVNIYGISSKKLTKSFVTRKDDYYGSVTLNLTGVEMPMIVQLLENNAREQVVSEKSIKENGSVLFEYLKPGKLKIKVIYDRNNNGKWDAGSYTEKVQPEDVAYVNFVHKVRSNFDEEISWDIKPVSTFVKNVRDLEEEEKQRKAEEEKKLKQKEEDNPTQPVQNLMQGGGTNIFR